MCSYSWDSTLGSRHVLRELRLRQVGAGVAQRADQGLVSASLAPYRVSRTLALLAEKFPGLSTRMEILVSPLMADNLLDHSADLGVAIFPVLSPRPPKA